LEKYILGDAMMKALLEEWDLKTNHWKVGATLLIPATDICAGDSHPIAYNTNINQIYIWGLYRVPILSYISDLNLSIISF